MELAIEAGGLSKKFKKNTAVSELDLQIQRGEIFGLLGPDGAGKTTAMRLLSTAMEQTSGEARILGLDVRIDEEKIRRKIGIIH